MRDDCRFCWGSGCLSCNGKGWVEEPVARATDPDTSWDAAASVDRPHLTTVRQGILDALLEHGAMTDEQIWRAIQPLHHLTSPSGARTRRRELVVAGLVEDSGSRIKGMTGRMMILWRPR